MSELAHDPEQKHEIQNPVHGNCPLCQSKLVSKYENTLVLRWPKSKFFNIVRIACKNDSGYIYTWEDQTPEGWADQFIGMEEEGAPYCDNEQIKAMRKRDLGITDIPEYEVSKRNLDNVKHWGEFLQKMVIDVSDFGGND